MIDCTGEMVYTYMQRKCVEPMIANEAVFLLPNFIVSGALLRAKGFAIGGQLPLAMGSTPPFARSNAFFVCGQETEDK